MLKIRDDVDLKELEKFDFKYHENKRNPSNSLYEWNDKMIEIKGSSEQIYIRAFDKRKFKKTFHATEGLWVPNNSETWYTQKFKNEWDKYCAAQGYWSSIWHEFSIQELQAINKKVEELGWIK